MRARAIVLALLPMALANASVRPVLAQSARFFPEKNPRAPFSTAVRAGDMVYASGQIGVAADGSVPTDIEPAAHHAMDNLKRAFAAAGVEMRDVVRCTVMLTDMSQWDAFNRVYVSYFEAGRLPARSATGANALALGASVEVECTAYKPLARR